MECAGPAARRLLDRFADMPVCVFDAAWTTIAWNPAWEALPQCGPDPGYRGKLVIDVTA